MSEKNNPIEMLFADESLSELSEDFKTKASVIFKDTVALKVAEEKKAIRENYRKKVEKEKEKIKEDMESKIDSYLTYVAEEWLKENQLAVDNGIQVEIAENFLSGMKQLFEESYVEVPSSKVNIVAEMAKELEEKTETLEEAVEENIKLSKELNEMKKKAIISECTANLADTQVAKVEELLEMVDFENEEQYKERVSSIVENYFLGEKKEEKKDTKDKKDDGDADDKMTEEMQSYVKSITESLKF